MSFRPQTHRHHVVHRPYIFADLVKLLQQLIVFLFEELMNREKVCSLN